MITRNGNKIASIYREGISIAKAVHGNMLVWFKNKSRLPKEYQEVEYLESTGTQWIDTGFYWDDGDWRCNAIINPTQSIHENYIISQKKSGEGVVYAFVYIAYKSMRIGYTNNVATFYDVSDDFFNNIHTFHADYKNGNQTLLVDDNILLKSNKTFTPFRTEDGSKIVIGGVTTYGGRAYGVRFYDIEIIHNVTEKKHFVPCYRKADNVAGMYDLVSGEFFTNQGTGEFIIGGNVRC